jgi:hypothetical protein
MIKLKKINGKFLVSGIAYNQELKSLLKELCIDKNKCILNIKSDNIQVQLLSECILKINMDKLDEILLIKREYQDEIYAFSVDNGMYFKVVKHI